MERITAQEAENYIPINKGKKETIEDAVYFTLTPSKLKGFEDVTYYKPQLKSLYSNRKGEGDSWVYVLSNESQPNMYKIGYTGKEDVEERVKQLSRSTSVATPFILEWAFRCFNGERLEGEVHRVLKGYRITKDREFFAVSLDKAKETIEDLGQNYI